MKKEKRQKVEAVARRMGKTLHGENNAEEDKERNGYKSFIIQTRLHFLARLTASSTTKRPKVFSSTSSSPLTPSPNRSMTVLWSLGKRKVCRWFEERIMAEWRRQRKVKRASEINFFIGILLILNPALLCAQMFSSCFLSIYIPLSGDLMWKSAGIMMLPCRMLVGRRQKKHTTLIWLHEI